MTWSLNVLTNFLSLPLVFKPTNSPVIQAHTHLDTFGMRYERTDRNFNMALCDEMDII